ncbi:MAG: ATP-dependent Clp protease ATP-binding subunit [Cytophagales bacterium]|nr:ATP-dependent Clp protease ATP-binding subunit [Cytophagales bacterium]
MEARFSKRVKEVISLSREEALRLKHDHIDGEHLFLGIVREGEGHAITILEELGVKLPDVTQEIEKALADRSMSVQENRTNIPLTRNAEKILKITYLEAKIFKSDIIDTEHLLLSILRDESNNVSEVLRSLYDLSYESIKTVLNSELDDRDSETPSASTGGESPMGGGQRRLESGASSDKTTHTASKTPILDNFGIDLTQAAEEGKIDPIIGRSKEIERVAQILTRRKKNNPLLIGEPGVGKTAIAEGLALRIVQRKVAHMLLDKRVVTLEIGSLVAGTKYRGQFEERMKGLMNELREADDVILFIDEIHTMVGAGGTTGSLDASNMFKPPLARGELQVIGATTLDEYRETIEKDGALARRFQMIIVDPTSPEETLEILHNVRDKYEEHHRVDYTEEALVACVKLSDRYISDRFFPDKAIDILDEVGARVHIQNIHVPEVFADLEKKIEEATEHKHSAVDAQDYEKAAHYRDEAKRYKKELDDAHEIWEEEMKEVRHEASANDVADVIASMTGIPVQKVAEKETAKLVNLQADLTGRVIGQPDAIKHLTKAIQRTRVGLKDPNKPIGSFIFLGPTGVGKTELAKVLAKQVFDKEDSLIRIDMSEYMEKFAVSRLMGAPPGYVGYEEGGQLTEKVRRKPYSVILFDEIEKAHPDIFNVLLQVLDDGVLTDGLGRKVDFRNTIIIMTSNIGMRDLESFGTGIGFNTQSRKDGVDDAKKMAIQGALKKAFAPEFLNRLDDVIVFNELKREDIHKIIDISLSRVLGRVKELGYSLELTDEAKDFIADRGYDPKFGARPLNRALQKHLEDALAEEILSGNVEEGDNLIADFDKEEKKIVFKVKDRENDKEVEKDEEV